MKFSPPLTSPLHHPSLETLTSYAAGTLRAGFDFVVAAHVRHCAACRSEVEHLEGVGGALLAQSSPVGVSHDALARALARIESKDHAAQPERTLDSILDAAKRRWVAPGVWVAKVDTPCDRLDRVYLLSVASGVGTAEHSHTGIEFTQILSGALDDQGTIYRAGDFCEADAAQTHRPHVSGGEACVCLFATEGRLVPKGLIGRVAFALANV